MYRRLEALLCQRGQAMVELTLVLPVILLFFAAVFYFGHGMNQKIENRMAVHYAAFFHNRDEGRDPDDKLQVDAGDLEAAFFTRGASVTLEKNDWGDPEFWYGAYTWDTFNIPWAFSNVDFLTWLPNTVVGAYLSLTGLPSGSHCVTRSTVSPTGMSFAHILEGIGGKTTTAELYVDSNPRKLETVSFNFDPGDIFDPGSWDFGYMPMIVAWTIGWDWDFASIIIPSGDTNWP